MVHKLKNIFVIPSWYPSKSSPLFGSFIKEQALAIANHRPEYQIIVSLRSDVDVQLSVNKPLKIIAQFIHGTFSLIEQSNLTANFIELRSPAFSLKYILKICSAITRLFALSERNLKYAIDKYGEISLIHAHVGYPAGYVAARLSKKYGIPFIITEHMGPFPLETMIDGGQLIPQLRFAYENASGSIAVSNSLAHRIASFGIPTPFVVPNMINESIFKPKTKTFDNFKFLSVGGLTEEKGFNDLLDAIHMWSPENNVKFKIIGSGPLLTSLKHRSKLHGIDHYIEWMGNVSRDQIPEEFSNCNAFVLPSHYETFGIVYAEALACGKPIIATKCGGPEEIVNSFNGLLIEKKNPAKLADALNWMYRNWQTFEPENIRRDFELRFSEKAVTKKIAAIYEQVIF